MIKFEIDSKDPVVLKAVATALNTIAGLGLAAPHDAQEMKTEDPVNDVQDSPEMSGAPEITPTEPTESVKDVKLDHKGVPFNPDFCGEATEPFYTTGPMTGQWKKKRGVSEEDYKNWYAAQLKPLEGSPPANTAAAFSTQPPPPPSDAPKDLGSLMVFISENQAAGKIDQDSVNAAWGEADVNPQTLFMQPDPAILAAEVAKVYNVVKAKLCQN